MPIQEVNIENHPVIDSDEETFIFGQYEVKVNGEYCGCPVTDAFGISSDNGEYCGYPVTDAFGINSDKYDEFTDEFDTEAGAKVDARGSDSDTTHVAIETENMMAFSSVLGGLMTETAAKRVIERLTRFDPTVEPSEKQKEAAQQACEIASELGWDEIIPDVDNRYWY
mgnify:FL=1